MLTKKINFLFLLLIGVTGYAHAQALSESVKISEEQVPVSVKKSYEKEFGQLPEGGKWTVRVTRTTEQGRVVNKPVSYSFTKGSKKEKIEVRFSPDGEIKNSKGLARKDQKLSAEPGASQQTDSN